MKIRTKANKLVRILHINAIKDGNLVKMPKESIWEVEKLVGNIKTNEKESVGWALARIKDSGMHYHNKATEYYFVTNGRGTAYLDGKKVNLKKYDILIIPPKVVHFVKSQKGIDVVAISSPQWKKEDHILL
jgi:mannose-6-phosphate isomerase-like protein (cupin superfamily)